MLALTISDLSGELAQAFIPAQELQFLHAPCHDRADAQHRLYMILDPVRPAARVLQATVAGVEQSG